MANDLKRQKINTLKKGDLFRVFINKGGVEVQSDQVYVYDGYNRFTRKYSAYKFEDISAFREWPKSKDVTTDFIF